MMSFLSHLGAQYALLPFVTRGVICFIAAILFDITYALYTLRTAARRPASAATYGALVYIFGAVNVSSYTADMALLLPIVVGGWIGTYSAVWNDAREVKRSAASARVGG